MDSVWIFKWIFQRSLKKKKQIQKGKKRLGIVHMHDQLT